ncbi:MAG: Rad52/Rad22 family DNA repair protein [Steroidobacteraceae bacterium]
MQDSEQLSEKFTRLRAPFDIELVKWRVGARMKSNRNRGQAMPYINARLVQDRLDEVMGPGNWRNEFTAAPMGGGMMCVISLRIGDEWVSKADVAQQDEVSEDASNPEKDREIAVKGAASDAFKRAAVQWGIGRYLYSFEAPWVNLEKEAYIARDEMPRLRKLLRDAFPGAQSAESPNDAGSRTTGHGADERSGRGDGELERAAAGSPEQAASAGQSEAPAAADGRRQDSMGGAGGSAKKGRPSFGTDEQWKSITARQRLIVKSISDRVRHNAPLGDIETFLTHGEGAKYPEWLRDGLLEGVRRKMKEQAAQAAQHSEVA